MKESFRGKDTDKENNVVFVKPEVNGFMPLLTGTNENDGWLRLTPDEVDLRGAFYIDKAFASEKGVLLVQEYF